MKSTLLLMATTVLTLSMSAQDRIDIDQFNIYVLGGISLYEEDVDNAVGGGRGLRLGAGAQVTQKFGVEWIVDITPNIETYLIGEVLTDFIGEPYKLETSGHVYSTLFFTSKFSVAKNLSAVAKFGYSSHVYEIEYEFRRSGQNERVEYRLKENESTPVVSLGVMFPIRSEQRSLIEVSVTRFFKESVSATALNFSLRQKF